MIRINSLPTGDYHLDTLSIFGLVKIPLFVLPTGAIAKHCYFCAEQDSATCLAKQQNQTCATDPNSLGTAHCASVVVRYRNQFGKTMEGFFRGCVDCSSR